MVADRPCPGVMVAADDGPGRPVLELVTQQFIDALAGGPVLDTLSPAAARTAWLRLQSAPVGKPSVRVQDRVFPVGPTGQSACAWCGRIATAAYCRW